MKINLIDLYADHQLLQLGGLWMITLFTQQQLNANLPVAKHVSVKRPTVLSPTGRQHRRANQLPRYLHPIAPNANRYG